MPLTRNDPSIQRTFRLHAKTFFLTYSQCPVEKEIMRRHLENLGRITKLAIGQEHHQDGNLHLHCLVQYSKKINVRSPEFFDYEEYHPSIESPRNIQASINYCCKEDSNPILLDCQQVTDDTIENLYELAKITPEIEFFEKCRKQKVSIH